MNKCVVLLAGLLLPVLAVANDSVLDESAAEGSYLLLLDDQTDLHLGLGSTAQAPDFAPFARQLPVLTADDDFREAQRAFGNRFNFRAFNFSALKNWVLGFRTSSMELDVSFDDSILDEKLVLADTGVLFKPASNVGVGLHYSLFSAEGRFEDDDIISDIDLEYKGPRLSFDLSF